jgi:putative ABC transporter, ATP-binding protein
MYKFCSIQFKGHPVLGNLSLNFCDKTGNPVDTVILAGENGVGKSTILHEIYHILSNAIHCEIEMEIINELKEKYKIHYFRNPEIDDQILHIKIERYVGNELCGSGSLSKLGLKGIYSDTEIGFKGSQIYTVSSSQLDAFMGNRMSSPSLPNEIKQLLIDIQALDDAAIAQAVQDNQTARYCELQVPQRMKRFTTAFGRMFDDLSYSRIDNVGGHKEIYFRKKGKEIPIDALSSGEKQIVYRGCFFLRDRNAMNGAFVFIDEPEISLHPKWQMKIMDYYKGIFSDAEGKQTSQIFVVTHSPFIIHNENRRNDKVIVLARDSAGNIIVKDRPEYYNFTSEEAVQDAFAIDMGPSLKSRVFLEGKTDVQYFKKAAEAFGMALPFDFVCVGSNDEKKNAKNTGCTCIKKAYKFLTSQQFAVKFICLSDCDTGFKEESKGNVLSTTLKQYDNQWGITKGIENALVFPASMNKNDYYKKTKFVKGDGGDRGSSDLIKTKLCDAICHMPEDVQREILIHLKEKIEELLAWYNGESGYESGNQKQD